MAVIEIQDPAKKPEITFALFALGFRPFFLGGVVFAAISMLLWTLVYSFQYPLALTTLSPFQWHAHEMVYGYSMAVIAGFLLTAVRNWTSLPTPSGAALAVMFCLWVFARVLYLWGDVFLAAALAADLSFALLFLVAISYPIIKAQQKQQMAIVAKIALLLVFHVLFACGVLGWLEQGVTWGIYGAFYLVLSLIFTLARRVLPFFIERGVGYPVTLKNSKFLDIASLVLFLFFFINEVFFHQLEVSAVLAACLMIIHSVRLMGWHTKRIWRVPLLWSFYLAMWVMVLGFALFALMPWVAISKFIALHALAVGGIGVITASMMARVSLGHTGRVVAKPPKAVYWFLAGLLLAVLVRVVLPLLLPNLYNTWILISQLLWIASFTLFALVYAPMWWLSRVDGKAG